MNISAVWKPWYVYRPHQLARRVRSSIAAPQRGYRLVPVSWGVELWADPAEHLGRSISTTGVFDLAVSEVLFRLIRPSDLFVDAGANLGYMTLLGAVASGPRGGVVAFEPNPALIVWLNRSIERAREQYAMSPVELHATALGAVRGTATLVLPESSAANDGLAHIATAHEQDERATHDPSEAVDSVRVSVEKLDQVIGERTVGVVKIDVEGHEQQVLEGATDALQAHRIRHIVFEDHYGAGSEPMALLRAAGYEIFSIGWSMRGPVLAPAADGSLATAFEAPSYLATTEPVAAIDACRPRRWLTLQRQAHRAGGDESQ